MARECFVRDGLWVDEPRHALTEAQVALVHGEALSFFAQVTHTVQMRALHHDLAQGFVNFRERGNGRFDMNVPALDGPDFDFLRRADAPWMPLVRAMLSGSSAQVKECKLIHMGVFLSLPGSDTQVYHTDGVHQSAVVQLPPHALNVFVPLIDLADRKAGPTEFSLGSHVLGRDAWDKTRLEVPCVPKGTAIIFDYRLGHRGLGNRLPDGTARPVLYFTYSNKPRFSDDVNFSRRRYLPLPPLLPLPAEESSSREGRLMKRSVPGPELPKED